VEMLNVSVEVGRHSHLFPVTIGEHGLENILVKGRSIRSSCGLDEEYLLT